MTKFVIHIGDHKTGTTAIQSSLASAFVSCPGARILYPKTGRAVGGINHALLARCLGEQGKPPGRAKFFKALQDEIRQTGPHIVVISSENFEDIEPQPLLAALQQYFPADLQDLRVVAYVRPHAARLVSSYSELLKIGLFHGTMDEFNRRTQINGRFKYLARFQSWRAVFGDRFILRPFVRDRLSDQDVVSDFMAIVLGDTPFTLQTPPRANESLCLEDLAILRALHKPMSPSPKTPPPERRSAHAMQHTFGWTLARHLLADASPTMTKVQLHRALATDIVDFYRGDATALDAAFFDGTPMLDDLLGSPATALDQPQSVELAAHFDASQARMIRVWAALNAQLLQVNPADFARALKLANAGADGTDTEEGRESLAKDKSGPVKKGPMAGKPAKGGPLARRGPGMGKRGGQGLAANKGPNAGNGPKSGKGPNAGPGKAEGMGKAGPNKGATGPGMAGKGGKPGAGKGKAGMGKKRPKAPDDQDA